jgi:hypothetical protein
LFTATTTRPDWPRLEEVADRLDVVLRDVVVEVTHQRTGAAGHTRCSEHAGARNGRDDRDCCAGEGPSPCEVLGGAVVALDLQLARRVLREHGRGRVVELAVAASIPNCVEVFDGGVTVAVLPSRQRDRRVSIHRAVSYRSSRGVEVTPCDSPIIGHRPARVVTQNA